MQENIHEEKDLAPLMETLGHSFANRALLFEALCHGSYAGDFPEESLPDNQRLEFLGDAVLGLVVGHLLLERYTRVREGDLSRMRAKLVNSPALAEMAREINLGASIYLSRGEEAQSGWDKDNILADAFEAVVGALYLDGGYFKAFEFISGLFSPLLPEHPDELTGGDYKTALQHVAQRRWQCVPEYALSGEEGPAHDKTFEVEVSLPGGLACRGKGKSKKAAEQDAARRVLREIRALDRDKAGRKTKAHDPQSAA